MEPRIQYARTSDGVSIAYWTLGEGAPLVVTPSNLYSHSQLEWQWPEWRRWYERLARGRKIIRYDWRGGGLSDRYAGPFSLDTGLSDLQAVVEHLAFDSFNLLGSYGGGLAAITYAGRYPDRVSRLVLWSAFSRWPDFSPAVHTLAQMVEQDWEFFTELVGTAVLGSPEGGEAKRYADLMRQGTTPEAYRNLIEATMDIDVTSLLPRVRSPTLLLQRRQATMPAVDAARALASGIPDARLVLLEGASREAWLGDMESVASAIDEFLGEGEEASRELPSGTAIILFADVADSTALTERLGDAPFRDRARQLDTSLRNIIRDAEGTPVEGKLLGDGVLAVFTSARQAIGAALACGKAGEAAGLPLHLGIHAGDVIREEDNVYGGAVNLAARIAGASVPGEVLVSQTVRDLARTSAGVIFEDKGQRKLKGVEGRQRLFAVRVHQGD